MLSTTIGQLMINEALPEDLRDYRRTLDKKGLGELLEQVGRQYPDRYREISKKLSDLGRDFAYTTGGHSFGLRHLQSPVAGRLARNMLQQELDQIYADKRLTDDQRDEKILEAAGKVQATLADRVYDEAFAADNPLARQIKGAGRGNKYTLNSLLGSDLLYTDHRGRPIPIPVLRNYSQGLRPIEYFAGAFGARKGIIDLKTGTSDAGYMAKQLTQLTHRLKVTGEDDPDEIDDPDSPRGFPVDTEDSDNEGALLARGVGPYPRNTELTPRILKDLKSQGVDQILVRSPTVGGPADGGVYARDVGRRERGTLAPVGDYVGIAAANALSEPLTQAQISSKHSGGVAGAAGAAAVSGFAYINRLVQGPKHFPGAATHAQVDGQVRAVEEAPHGGHYVTVDGKKHYVPQGVPVTVKRGDEVEAGDVLSEGIPHPAEVVKFKGIGEGRRYFTHAFRDALRGSGLPEHRRNVELLARGLINHVKLTDEVGDWAPDDVVPYRSIEKAWQPRPGHVIAPPSHVVGRYLEKPVLHYSVGTRVRKNMLPLLEQHGVKAVTAHDEPPPFEPTFIRGMANISHDPDWMTRLLGSYQSKGLLESARRGAVSDESGTSYVPALAKGVDFGDTPATKGWELP